MEKPPVDPEHYRFLGALVGTTGSLIYFWPRTVKDAIRRGLFSMMAGSIFYYVSLDFFEWDMSPRHVIGGAALVSFIAWPLAGLVLTAVKNRTAP